MFTLLLIGGLVGGGIFVEKKYSPNIKHESDGYYLHYTSGKGTRNKKKLF